MIANLDQHSQIDFVFKTLRQLLDLSIADIKLSQMSADASIKQYFRVEIKSKAFILLALPVTGESSEEEFSLKKDRAISQAQSFIETGTWLNEKMDHLPTIYGYNMARGLVLLSDNGAKNLFDYLPTMPEATVENYYKALVDWIVKLESSSFRDLPQSLTRQFTESALLTELMDFIDYGVCCGNVNKQNNKLKNDLQDEFKYLVTRIAQLPKVLIHRDFQSKNVLCDGATSEYTIIDYQDMCIGSKYYDLASLVFDPYINLNRDQLEKILRHYFALTQPTHSYQTFINNLNLVAIQRLLKAAGRYARLKYLYGKDTHMQFFEPALKKTSQIVAPLAEFRVLNQAVNKLIADLSNKEIM